MCTKTITYADPCPQQTVRGVCNTQPCVQDCLLSTDVDRLDVPKPCNATCGSDGYQYVGAYRVQQAPRGGGKACADTSVYEPCNVKVCPTVRPEDSAPLETSAAGPGKNEQMNQEEEGGEIGRAHV